MNITKLLKTIFAPVADSTPLARLSLAELRERQASFVVQAEVLDREIAAAEPAVARATAEAAIGGVGAPTIDAAEQARTRLRELREARQRVDDALVGVGTEIAARLADQDVELRAAKRKRMHARLDDHVESLHDLREAMVVLVKCWAKAKRTLTAVWLEVPFTERPKLWLLNQGVMLLDIKTELAVLEDQQGSLALGERPNFGSTNLLTSLHDLAKEPSFADRTAAMRPLLDQIVLRPEDCAEPAPEQAAQPQPVTVTEAAHA